MQSGWVHLINLGESCVDVVFRGASRYIVVKYRVHVCFVACGWQLGNELRGCRAGGEAVSPPVDAVGLLSQVQELCLNFQQGKYGAQKCTKKP